jgi:PEP-CTERM motif
MAKLADRSGRRFLSPQIARLAAAALLIAAAATAWADSLPPGLFVVPSMFSASVQENLLPGGSVFSNSQVVDSGVPGAAESVDLLHTTNGVNASGRSTQIRQGFASAQADVHGNGGVGATNLLFGPAQPGTNAVDQLAATALWTQTFTNTGGTDIGLALYFHIPDLEVGLIGVAPNRGAPSATETARAVVSLDSTINRADGSFVKGRSFSFGLEMHETQIPLGPGIYANFGDVQTIKTGSDLGINPFDSFHAVGDEFSPGFPFQPRYALDALSFSFTIGTIHPGDILSYVYTLTADGATLGGEHGYLAFLGDPFDFSASGGSLEVAAAAVPEPATWALSLAGLVLLAGARRRLVSQAGCRS